MYTPVDYIAKQQLRDIQNETNKVYRAEARDDLLREAVANAVKALPETKHFTAVDRVTTGSALDELNSLVVALGDIHYGDVMDVKGFLGEQINYYDESVCETRMHKLLLHVLEIAKRENSRTIHVMLVGDCIAGMLRMSQLQTLKYGVVDSTIGFSEMFAEWVYKLAQSGLDIHVHMVGGNHDEVRPLGSKAGEFPKDNMIKIINWYLAERFRDIRNVDIQPLTGRFHYVDVEGFKFLMLHGDGGKIQDICRDAVNVYGHHIDYFVCGHLHHEEELASGTTKDGQSIIVRVPSLCGMDGYAQKLGRCSKPGATVMVMQHGYGRRCVYPIELK